ncbi:carbohydrate ABC transporter permease [Nocardioides endophyticus]|uniref:carbohydrate ABC transporter permease n=1 Tax=Nocardioides endophyticus TaxID=1353775 RepID=UPI0031E847CE
MAFLITWTLLIAFPLYWTITMALKPKSEWTGTTWFPSKLEWSNFAEVLIPGYGDDGLSFIETPIKDALGPLKDSLVISVGGTLLAVILGTAAAYAISRYRFGGSLLPFNILSVRMFPPIAAIIPLMVMFSTVQLVDSYVALILVYGGLTAPYAVWLTKSFIDDLPRELEEASMLDGNTRLGALTKVTLPLIAGSVATTALFVFIVIWSDFVIAFTLGGTNVEAVSVRIASLTSATQGQLYGPQAALGLIAALPAIVLGLSIQKYLARGLTFGAVKR